MPISRILLALAICSTFLAVCVFEASWLAGRLLPSAASTVLIVLLAVLLPLAASRPMRLDRGQASLLALGFGLLAWIGIAQVTGSAPVSTWWKHLERLLAITAALVVMTARVAPGRQLRWLGAAGALAAAVAIVPAWWYGRFEDGTFFWSFGLGHPNQLLNTGGLAAVAFAVYLVAVRRAGGRIRWSEWVAAAIGMLAVTAFAWGMSRRSVSLAIMFGFAVIGLDWIWRHHRRTAVALLLMGVVLAAAAALWAMSLMYHGARFERGLIYTSVWESALPHWLLGRGHFAARLIFDDHTPTGTLFVSTGNWSLHSHSEPLDVFADGGLIGFILFAAIMILTWWRVLAIRHAPERTALLFLVGAATVVAFVDNAYSRLMGEWWLALAAGLVFHRALGSGDRTSWELQPRALLPVSLLAGWATTAMTSLAFASLDASPAVLVRTVRQTLDPEMLAAISGRAAEALEAEGNHAAMVAAMAIQDRRMGSTAYSLSVQANGLFRMQNGDGPTLAKHLQRLADAFPFGDQHHALMVAATRRQPEIIPLLNPITLLRARRMAGEPGLPPVIDPARPVQGNADAAMRLGEARWLAVNGADWSQVKVALGAISERYPIIPDVATVFVRFLIAAPMDLVALPDSVDRTIARGFPLHRMYHLLDEVRDRERAARLLHLLAYNTEVAGYLEDCRNHTITPGRIGSAPQQFAARIAIVRLWGNAGRP